MRLIGELVVLRAARPKDADVLAQDFADDPSLGAMLGIEPDQENAEWLRSTFTEDGHTQKDHKTQSFAITRPDSGELIGEIGLVGLHARGRPAALRLRMRPPRRQHPLRPTPGVTMGPIDR